MKGDTTKMNTILQEIYNKNFNRPEGYKCKFFDFIEFTTVEKDDNSNIDLLINGNVVSNIDLLELSQLCICLYSCYQPTPDTKKEEVSNDND